jgi:hypothetical protein
MIMPYGTKPVLDRDDPDAPTHVNFDQLWQLALKPAVDELGYEAVRADQDLGVLIIHEMIERLAISDLVIADVTIGNANVYYEIGVRHAAKRQGCVLIAAQWAKPLFDLEQMRRIPYPLPGTDIDEATADRIRRLLVEAIPRLGNEPSPLYTILPGYPDRLDPSRTSAFRETLRRLSEFQAELSAVRVAPRAEQAERARRVRDKHYRGGPIQQAVAVELVYLLRDFTDAETTTQFIGCLPKDIRDLPVISEQRALVVSQSGDSPAAIGALEQLIDLNGDTSERRGLLGGRYKRLYQAATDPAAAARYLDLAIENYDLGMHLDLNDYYPASNLARLYQTRGRRGDVERARIAAAITLVACQRSLARNPADEWAKPTMLTAAFDAGDVDAARDLADEVRAAGPAMWKLNSIIGDLDLAVRLHDGDVAATLQTIVAELRSLLRERGPDS